MLMIGLMSGTSVDGIDAALVEIDKPDGFEVKVRGFVCEPWSPKIKEEIIGACQSDASIQRVTALNFLLGEFFADAAISVVESSGVSLREVGAIASHGQTIWHQPKPFELGGMSAIGTLQIGEPSVIARRTGCTVVSDFRTADMALGGQGAPLVPFADYALFGSKSESRCIQNLGGIANVTYLPAGGKLDDLIAFDIGPCNLLLDAFVRRNALGIEFDEGGQIAMQGKTDFERLPLFLSHPFFKLKPPKSTGREMFDSGYCDDLYSRMKKAGNRDSDILATACAAIARSIAAAYRDFLPSDPNLQTVVLGGGGVCNRRLTVELRGCLPEFEVKTHADFGISDDAKEAVAFAILGYETLHRRPSNVPSATGARGSAVLGKITYV